MFTKTPDNPSETGTRPEPMPHGADPTRRGAASAPRGQRLASLLAGDMTVEGNILGGGELQVDGTIKGDVRVERVTVGDGGHVDGGIFAEAVEVHGKVSGSITAREVHLHSACEVDADITNEHLTMETGASFQGRSMRLKDPAPARKDPASAAAATTTAAQPTIIPQAPRAEPASRSTIPKDTANGLGSKALPTP